MNWDTHYGQLLHDVASKSADPSSKYGAIIVDRHMNQRSTGYNGLPRGIEFTNTERFTERPSKYWWWIHAEENSIYNAARSGISIDECSMYVISIPCLKCMCAIVQTGIKEVIYFNDPPPMDGETWRNTIKDSADLARQVHILLRRGGDR